VRLGPLTIKLLRDLWRLRAQSIAIALVIAAGVGMVIMSFGMIRSLEATRSAYYDVYRFADIFAPVRRAHRSAIFEVRELPGVAYAEGRGCLVLDVPGIVSRYLPHAPSRLRWPQPAELRSVDCLLRTRASKPSSTRPSPKLQGFAGDRLTGLIYGGGRPSPGRHGPVAEYVYAVAHGQIFPDNRFGVVWMNREPRPGCSTSGILQRGVDPARARRASQDEDIRRLDRLLDRYGSSGAYGRDLQISDGSFPMRSTSWRRPSRYCRPSSSPSPPS
jgi:putative ABC transport system permease protein